MDVTVTSDAEAFARTAAAYLEHTGVRGNVVASIVSRALAGTASFRSDWICVRDTAGDLVAAAMHSHGYPPYLPPMPAQAARAIARTLLERGPLTGVNGDADAARAFAEEIVRLGAGQARRVMAQGLYRLGRLVPPDGVAGQARVSTAADADTCFAWVIAFQAEALHDEPAPTPERFAERVGQGRFVLWEDDAGRVVSMAGASGPDLGVGRIGPVYTPPAQRRHGYAAAVTAEAARRLLGAGARDVILFTDLANPTSNGVYVRIGFERIGDAAMWRCT